MPSLANRHAPNDGRKRAEKAVGKSARAVPVRPDLSSPEQQASIPKGYSRWHLGIPVPGGRGLLTYLFWTRVVSRRA